MNINYFLLLFFGSIGMSSGINSTTCNLRETKYGKICICTATHCDYLRNPQPAGVNDYTIVSSSKDGLRFSTSNGRFGTRRKHFIKDYSGKRQARTRPSDTVVPPDLNTLASILVDGRRAFLQFALSSSGSNTVSASRITVRREKRYQKITGFGGAFTGSVSYILTLLEQKLQDHIYKSYFHQDGIAFNMLRIPIAGCDFDLEPWAYNESPRDDPNLSNFTKLEPRDELKIKQIQRLKEISEVKDLKIKAAAWSSPTWMKTNNRWTGFSQLKPEYYQTWANYHLRFLELMAAKNMPIWAISTGNEPLNGIIGFLFVPFMSLGWTPKTQALWLSENLGPTIRKSKFKDVLIFSNDDQRYTFPGWFRSMNSSRPEAIKYIDGLAVHWYYDDIFAPELIDWAHQLLPDKLLINTESCVGDRPNETHGPELGSWERAEKYIRSYLQDLQHNFNGWIDWNIILNEQGGPNYVNNFVDSPIIVNTTNRQEFYKQPIYYGIGHFSKFIPEGSIRIETQVSNMYIDSVAFLRPDNRIALIIFNSAQNAIDVTLDDSLRGNIVINIPVRSVHTIIYN